MRVEKIRLGNRRWNSTLPHVVDAKTFPTLMPTLFGYGPALDVLEGNLRSSSPLGREWEDSLMFLSAVEGLDENKRERTLQAARIYAEEFELVFESDYELVSQSENFQVFERKKATPKFTN